MEKEKKYCHVGHTFEPVFDSYSRVLILGSFPSVKSREQNFYYGHPQNRFWKVMAQITGWKIPESISEKREMLLANRIAVWDVIASCSIVGSSDSSIRNVEINDFERVLSAASIREIYANGAKADELYRKYAFEQTGREIVRLPSTSPANAAWGVEQLCGAWSVIMGKRGIKNVP